MKVYRIAVQDGLEDLKAFLMEAGFEVLPPGKELMADVTIISEDDSDEEVSPRRMTYVDGNQRQQILIDATDLENEDVLALLELGRNRSLN